MAGQGGTVAGQGCTVAGQGGTVAGQGGTVAGQEGTAAGQGCTAAGQEGTVGWLLGHQDDLKVLQLHPRLSFDLLIHSSFLEEDCERRSLEYMWKILGMNDLSCCARYDVIGR